MNKFKCLTPSQKLSALSMRFYSGQQWEPKAGDYYTTPRDDLELYRVVKIESGKVYTEYCDKECGLAEWDEDGFTTKGFGVHRVHVPLIVLEQVKPCHHHWVDGLDGGTMVCAYKCGAWK